MEGEDWELTLALAGSSQWWPWQDWFQWIVGNISLTKQVKERMGGEEVKREGMDIF